MAELTPMQAAAWTGRHMGAITARVGSHLYTEFDGHGISPDRLRAALQKVYTTHPMLALRIDPDGRPSIGPAPIGNLLEVDDLRMMQPSDITAFLRGKRYDWTHDNRDLTCEQAARFSISQLPAGAFRLHVDTDMIAVDPSSFRIVMDDLAMFYENPDIAVPALPSFFDWSEYERTTPARRTAKDSARKWWREEIAHMAPAPTIPLSDNTSAIVKTNRLSAWLSAQERSALEQLAREQRITMTGLILALFSSNLARQTGDTRFRLNVPTFWRSPTVGRIVGDFSDMLILDVDIRDRETHADLGRRIAERMIDLISNAAYSGVNVMRDLSRYQGDAQTTPIVFTSALDMDGGELFSDRVKRVFGPMSWAVSQGPQVAIDAQIAAVDGGILINWDIRDDMLPHEWVADLFRNFVECVQMTAQQPQTFGNDHYRKAGTDVLTAEKTPLGMLQQAYLLGRGHQMPLGGVAMQEFREYRGHISPDTLRDRLTRMVAAHSALRTCIDPDALIQTTHDTATPNFIEHDLRTMTRDAALAHIDHLRDDYAHAIFDNDAAPWNVTMFRIAGGAIDTIVFARFDALILDGRSIATLMTEMFNDIPAPPPTTGVPEGIDRRESDVVYWQEKLAHISGPIRLPWVLPLEQISGSRYKRQSLRVAKDAFTAMSKIGAQQGFFQNTTITSLILGVLARWIEGGEICVGIPVAPLNAANLANRSSFLAVEWAKQGTLVSRAARLQSDILEGMQHGSYSGIDIARQLFETHGAGPVLPVVITNGLSWPVVVHTDNRTQGIHYHGGLTQTPQVAVDIRFSKNADGDLVFDIDYATAAITDAMIDDILRTLNRAIETVVNSSAFDLDAHAIIDMRHIAAEPDLIEEITKDSLFLSRIAANLFDPSNTKTALISGNERISYAELGQNVLRYMDGLHARNITRGGTVAICLHRGFEHTAIVLACALCGIRWVPIDAQTPPDRLEYLLTNCCPDIVVCTDVGTQMPTVVTPIELRSTKPAQQVSPKWLDDLSSSDDPAYLLYTSGTTGTPKCVVLSNRATENVIACTLRNWDITDDDVLISVTPLHHDMSVFDVLGCLTAGATLVLPEVGEEKNAVYWCELVAEHKVTIWCSVPAILEMLLACRKGSDLNSLRLVAQGGDYIKPSVISELWSTLPHARLVSLGGPTETTIWSIWHEIGRQDANGVPYGRALPRNAYLLLDDNGDISPIGVLGRMHVTGENLACGYLQDGKIVQTDFVTIKNADGIDTRAFKTGDLGRYRSDGTIMFAGRVNGYVKIRGVRVSLPDIESILQNHHAMQNLLVIDFGDEKSGEVTIGAVYVTKPGHAISASALRDYARLHLPTSHIPSRFVETAVIPLSRNGKPDRQSMRNLLLSPTQNASSKDTLSDKVNAIYAKILPQIVTGAINEVTNFHAIGLRPHHLKVVAQELANEFSISVAPKDMIPLRNITNVVAFVNARVRR